MRSDAHLLRGDARAFTAFYRHAAAAARRDEALLTAAQALAPRRRLWRAPILAGLAGLVVAGGALAAVLLPSGRPVPPARTHVLRQFGAGTGRLLPLRVPDPAGGLPWGMAVIRRGNLTCLQVGRVQAGVLGIIGRDGSFNDDGRFHPLSPDADQGQTCGGTARNGQAYLATLDPPVPASGYTGSFSSAVGGCRERVPASSMSPQTRRRLRHVPVCAAASLRALRYGLAGREATKVVVAVGHQRVAQTPGPGGAYLFVLPATSRFSLDVTYRDGTVCHPDRPPTRACLPPPGF
jgi:hypothetical protein